MDGRAVRGTVTAVERALLIDDGLLLRYDPAADGCTERPDPGRTVGTDGLPGNEGAFLACTFWLADARYCLGDTAQAHALFEHLLTLRNDVGLLAEEYDPGGGRQLGNTPQAFSSVGLINTARNLSGTATDTSAPGRHQRLHQDSATPRPGTP